MAKDNVISDAVNTVIDTTTDKTIDQIVEKLPAALRDSATTYARVMRDAGKEEFWSIITAYGRGDVKGAFARMSESSSLTREELSAEKEQFSRITELMAIDSERARIATEQLIDAVVSVAVTLALSAV